VKTAHSDNGVIETLQRELNLSHLCARILAARGFDDPRRAETFLYPKLDDLSDPFLLPDMEKAVLRLIRALQAKETICIYGDYDADGVTSVALMVNFLSHLGLRPLTYLPERREGYGLNIPAIRRFKEEGVTLIISLDCGSTNIEEIKAARSLGIDTIVIDHHEPEEELPPALALVNPKMKGARFPTRELAACGVTFFFLLALRRIMAAQGYLHKTINLKRELDLVTVGTIADMVPLEGDNRIIVKFGMDVMRKQPRTWLKSFFKSGVVTKRRVDEYTLGFIIIPRINAAGRVSAPEGALDFLVCENEGESKTLLAKLNDTNRQRQRIEEGTLREAIEAVNNGNMLDGKSIVLFNEGWHVGVIGIVAQKLTEIYKKPSIVITEVDGMWKGSGRGGEGIDLHEAIESIAHLLVRFGGHKYACGISLLEENLVAFREAFEQRVQSTVRDREKTTKIDAFAAFEELTADLLEFMERLSPFGMGNPRPNLLLKPLDIIPNNRSVKIIDGGNRIWHGTLQGQSSLPEKPGASIVASPILREDMGEKFIHLNIKEFVRQD
jgi:single-stranded-DNA-specific exonuclease